jgi:adenylate cyclase
MKLLTELHRRHVPRATVIYVAAAFAVLQAADLVFGLLGLPAASVRLVLGLALLGFPVALLLAWHFEITPEGIRRHTSVEPATVLARRGPWPLIVSAAVLVLLGTYAFAARQPGPSVKPDDAMERSVAVLPFQNLSDSRENEYFSDGITDDIITELAQLGELTVTSRTSAMPYKGSVLGVRAIAAELGVRHVLEGSVRRVGEHVRIVAQLVDARTDRYLWAGTYDRELRDVLAIQTEIAREIADALRVELTAAEARRMDAELTRNPRAYDLYLRSRALAQGDSYESSVAAMSLAREAVALDPAFAAAWAWLSLGYTSLVEEYGRPLLLVDSAIATAQHAIRLTPDHHHGYGALSYALFQGGRLREAYAMAQQASRRNPGGSAGLSGLALLEREMGDPAKSIEIALRGLRLDPRTAMYPNHIAVGWILLGDYDRADEWLRRGRAVDPSYIWHDPNEIWLEVLRGRPERAWQLARTLAEQAPDAVQVQFSAVEAATATGEWQAAREYGERLLARRQTYTYGDYRLPLAVAYVQLGDARRGRALAEVVAQELRRELQRSDRPALSFRLAYALAWAGDTDGAFAAWRAAIETGGYESPDALLAFPLPAGVREDPRFERVLGTLRARREELRRRAPTS